MNITIYMVTYTTHSCHAHTGGIHAPAPGEDKQDAINEAARQEIALSLVNKFESNLAEDNSMKALFVRYRMCMCWKGVHIMLGNGICACIYTRCFCTNPLQV